ncbi:MAG: ECF transporter S component [Firmicutes bacterium]|nr:ECF transporter S component [Bacillota bacterium]
MSLVLIPVVVGINYIGKLFAQTLKLPLWLDSIGTILAAFLNGPIVGAIAGLINNLIYGLTVDTMSFVYAITSVAIGLVSGVVGINYIGRGVLPMLGIGLLVGIAAALVSTPLNVIFWGGQTGNVWGDALFAALRKGGFPLWGASFLDEFVVDIPDKVATVIVAWLIFKGLPKRLTRLFRRGASA